MKRKQFGVRRQRRRFGPLLFSRAPIQIGVALRLPAHSKIVAALVALIISTQITFAAGPLGVRRPASIVTTPSTDWSVAMVESTMKRYPTADSLKGWGYAK